MINHATHIIPRIHPIYDGGVGAPTPYKESVDKGYIADGLWRHAKPLVAELLRRLVPDLKALDYQALIKQGEEVVHITQNVRNPFDRLTRELSILPTGSHNIYCAVLGREWVVVNIMSSPIVKG